MAMRVLLSIFIITFSLTGCTSSKQFDLRDSISTPIPSNDWGTNGRLIPIQSDNVRAAGYEETSMVMTVQFQNGATYEYYEVPTNIWTSFLSAQPHPWSQVGYPLLVEGGFRYRRIG